MRARSITLMQMAPHVHETQHGLLEIPATRIPTLYLLSCLQLATNFHPLLTTIFGAARTQIH